MIDGFIKVPRALSAYPELQKHDAFYVLFVLLSLMRFRQTYMDGVSVAVNQLVISKPELARRCGVSESRLKYILTSFERAGGISTENNRNKSTLITVLERYLPEGEASSSRPETDNRVKRYKNAVGQTGLLNRGVGKASALNKPFDAKAENAENAAPEKRAYGVFMNVYLSEDEYERLSRYSEKRDAWIDKLSSYMHSSDKRYPDHFATLISWISDDKAKRKSEVTEQKKTFAGSFTVREDELNAIMEKARSTVPVLKKRNR